MPIRGTSPRAWGKLTSHRLSIPRKRNIPTCVGKTWQQQMTMHMAAEHPHVRGENSLNSYEVLLLSGTSPRAWGKRCWCSRFGLAVRNIPTCVGKTGRSVKACFNRSEHPHVRGENIRRTDRRWIHRGTSPRAWGKRDENAALCHYPRNIPTCVGKTVSEICNQYARPEHPHVRGENAGQSPKGTPPRGTSPRAWGKPWCAV